MLNEFDRCVTRLLCDPELSFALFGRADKGVEAVFDEVDEL